MEEFARALLGEEGVEKIRMEGKREQSEEFAKTLLQEDEPLERISRLTGLSIDDVFDIYKSLKPVA